MVLAFQTKLMLEKKTNLSCSYTLVIGFMVMSLKLLIFLDWCDWIFVQINPAFPESYGQVLKSFLLPSD